MKIVITVLEEIARHNTSRPNSNTNTNRHSTAEDVMNILNRRGTARTRTTTTRREWTIPNNQNTDADNTTNPTQHLADGRHLRDFVQFFNVDNLQDVVSRRLREMAHSYHNKKI